MGWNSDMADVVDSISVERRAALYEVRKWRAWARALAKRRRIALPRGATDREIRAVLDVAIKAKPKGRRR